MHHDYLHHIERALEDAIASAQLPSHLSEPIRYAIGSGGKRLRPLITVLATEACGGTLDIGAQLGAAIELLHNSTLIHDDIMDHSPLRRGKPTVHTKWGEAIAILAGDTMMGIAYRIIATALPPVQSQQVLDEFSSAFVEICSGQAQDLEFCHTVAVTMQEYLEMIERKTARLFATAAVVGALAAGAPQATIDALRRFGTALGIAFQIQDDVLDMFGNQQEFGKQRGQDVREGKKTYPVLLAAQKADDPADRSFLDRYFAGEPLSSDEHISHMIELCRRCGALDEAHRTIDAYLHGALAALEEGLLPSAACDTLRSIALQLRTRQS